MGQALYRKYRPKTLNEVVGQDHITTALSNAIKNGRLSHAFLLAGPKGVGKTSVARILAHVANNLNYDEQSAHLDIIEIDAASNRRIDEIRDLREKVHIAPAEAKYKVYIVDEVHMLTKEAFSALLKTLEEPPDHVIFILATTEPHKLPETIISRTQRLNFKPINSEDLVGQLSKIADKEKIDIDSSALDLIAQHSEGSFRDAISLLDQVQNTKTKINLDDIKINLGIAPAESLQRLLEALNDNSAKDLLDVLEALKAQGINASALAKQLSIALRETLLKPESSANKSRILKLLERLLDTAVNQHGYSFLEIVLLESIFDYGPENSTSPSEIKAAQVDETRGEVEKPDDDLEKSQKVLEISPHLWEDCLAIIKKERNTLYSLARMARPQFNASQLLLYFKFPFHQKRLDDIKNRGFIAASLKTLSGQDFEIVCLVEPKIEKSQSGLKKDTPTTLTKTSAVDNISNIFGQAEVLD